MPRPQASIWPARKNALAISGLKGWEECFALSLATVQSGGNCPGFHSLVTHGIGVGLHVDLNQLLALFADQIDIHHDPQDVSDLVGQVSNSLSASVTPMATPLSLRPITSTPPSALANPQIHFRYSSCHDSFHSTCWCSFISTHAEDIEDLGQARAALAVAAEGDHSPIQEILVSPGRVRVYGIVGHEDGMAKLRAPRRRRACRLSAQLNNE